MKCTSDSSIKRTLVIVLFAIDPFGGPFRHIVTRAASRERHISRNVLLDGVIGHLQDSIKENFVEILIQQQNKEGTSQHIHRYRPTLLHIQLHQKKKEKKT